MKARKVGYIKPMQGSEKSLKKSNAGTKFKPECKSIKNNTSMQSKKNKKFYSARGKTRS